MNVRIVYSVRGAGYFSLTRYVIVILGYDQAKYEFGSHRFDFGILELTHTFESVPVQWILN